MAGTSPFMDALTANGTATIQTSVTGVTAGKRKFIDDRRDQPFDKRLRFSVRQTESAYRYRDIVVRKQDGFTHILLSTKSSENNSLNPEVRDTPQATASCFSVPLVSWPALLGGTLCDLSKLLGSFTSRHTCGHGDTSQEEGAKQLLHSVLWELWL